MTDARPIGVFDSGLGGLTVLAELVRALPGESFIYLGDTARVPYGARSDRTIQRYSREAADWLLARDIKLFVIACNTATAYAGDMLQRELPVPVIGVVEPGVQALLSRSRNRRVGVIGTRATIRSDVYARRIRERDADIQVFSKACPLFVPLVEEGWIDKKITRLVVQEYLSELAREDVDTVVLGCTHYPLIKKTILSEFPELSLVDSSEETARAVAARIASEGLASDSARGTVKIYLTDLTRQMSDLESFLSGLTIESLEEVELHAG